MRRTALNLVAMLVLLTLPSTLSAQETVVIDALPSSFSVPAGLFATSPRLSSTEDGVKLIMATIGSEGAYGERIRRQLESSKDFYCVIHVLRWADATTDATGSKVQTVQAQNWYVLRGGPSWTQDDFVTHSRLWGSRGFWLLAVHLNSSADVSPYRLNYEVKIAGKQAQNVSNVLALAKLFPTPGVLGPRSALAPANLWAARYVPVSTVPSDITIAPSIVAVANNPNIVRVAVATTQPDGQGPFAPVPSSGQTVAAQTASATFQNDIGATTKPPAPSADQPTPTIPNTGTTPATGSTTTIAATGAQTSLSAQQQASQPFSTTAKVSDSPLSLGESKKFDNEGKYWWDVSVGVPVKKVNDFERVGSGTDVSVTKVSKSTAFALVNIFFPAVDLKGSGLRRIPHFVGGVGIEEKPLRRIFVGAGWGPLYANFFAGMSFKKVEAASNGDSSYEHEFTFGVNIPVLNFTRKLADQKK